MRHTLLYIKGGPAQHEMNILFKNRIMSDTFDASKYHTDNNPACISVMLMACPVAFDVCVTPALTIVDLMLSL